MASSVLPLATFKLPQSASQCSYKKLDSAIHVPTVCSSVNYFALLPGLRLSLTRSVWNLYPITVVPSKPAFILRAETDSSCETEAERSENVEEALSVDVQNACEAQTSGSKQPRVKLGEIMGILNRRAIEAADKERPTPDLRTGDIVEIKWAVPQNKRRFSIYRGIVISKQNAGIHTTIRVRRIIAGIGVEIVFPIYSPSLKEIKVVKHRKVRRARLYYLKDKLPRFSTFKW